MNHLCKTYRPTLPYPFELIWTFSQLSLLNIQEQGFCLLRLAIHDIYRRSWSRIRKSRKCFLSYRFCNWSLGKSKLISSSSTVLSYYSKYHCLLSLSSAFLTAFPTTYYPQSTCQTTRNVSLSSYLSNAKIRCLNYSGRTSQSQIARNTHWKIISSVVQVS